MFNYAIYENSQPDGIGVLEICGDREPRLFVPLKRTELTGEVLGPLAALTSTQIYQYSKEQCDKTLEALYRFPLPGDAAVTGVRVSFGETEVVGELKERERAESDYEEAKRRGRQAALASRESPDVFTLHLAGLQPNQEVRVTTSYVQLARVEHDNWSVRIPLTAAPRYVRSDEFTSRYAAEQPLALMRDPGHRFKLDLRVRGVESVRSCTHQLDLTPVDDGVRVQLRSGEIVPDRDCILTWQVLKDRDKPAIRVWLHDERVSDHVYFLALVAPPALHPQRYTPRETILLVDHSGSMEGAKWQASDWAVERFLLGLKEADGFALGLFHNTTRWFRSGISRADGNSIGQAIQFVKANDDSGGTELGVALEQALSLDRMNGDRARHILVITDAEVSDQGRILRLADEELGRVDRRRISVLCIDAAPNSHLAIELAERGGGVAKFLTSDPSAEDITTALDEILTDWNAPVLPGLSLEVNRHQIEAAGRSVATLRSNESSAIDLGDLPAGRAIWAAGRIRRGDISNLTFRLRTSRGEAVADYQFAAQETRGDHPAIKALFGARRVLALEYLIHSGQPTPALRERLARLGYDPGEVLTEARRTRIYAENVLEDARTALKSLLVREALEYGLTSSETAFIAVRSEAGKVIDRRVIVPNTLPAGWSDHFLSPPSTVSVASMSGPPAPTAPMACMDIRPAASGGAPFQKLKKLFVSQPPAAGSAPPDRQRRMVLFSGIPKITGSESILFDSTATAGRLPDQGTICLLGARFFGRIPKPEGLSTELTLIIFVGDLASPRARVRLVDLIRQGGVRPLNLLKQPGQAVRIVLAGATKGWEQSTTMEVTLGWNKL